MYQHIVGTDPSQRHLHARSVIQWLTGRSNERTFLQNIVQLSKLPSMDGSLTTGGVRNYEYLPLNCVDTFCSILWNRDSRRIQQTHPVIVSVDQLKHVVSQILNGTYNGTVDQRPVQVNMVTNHYHITINIIVIQRFTVIMDTLSELPESEFDEHEETFKELRDLLSDESARHQILSIQPTSFVDEEMSNVDLCDDEGCEDDEESEGETPQNSADKQMFENPNDFDKYVASTERSSKLLDEILKCEGRSDVIYRTWDDMQKFESEFLDIQKKYKKPRQV